jgi:hypothetical protein
MAKPGTPRRRPDAPSFAPTSLTEIARRYYACAVALAKAMGVPMSETFMREHRESISCCFIEAGRAGVRLPPAVQLPPLTAPSAASVNGQAPEPEEVPSSNGHGATVDESRATHDDDMAPNHGAVAPSLVAIPTDAGLPCGGQVIADLKPAQLAMLISKTARLVQDEGAAWVPLLGSLQAERGRRLERGRQPRRPDPDPVGHVEVPEGEGDVP